MKKRKLKFKGKLQGFPHACRTKWTKAKWERCVKGAKKKKGYNPYAVCNARCLSA